MVARGGRSVEQNISWYMQFFGDVSCKVCVNQMCLRE